MPIIMMIGLGLGNHFRDALEKSGKETFTKEEEQKSKEAELSKLGILPKSGIS